MKTSLKCTCGNVRFGFILNNSFVAGSLFRLDDNSGLEFIICRQIESTLLENLKTKVNHVMCAICHRFIKIKLMTDSVATEIVIVSEPEVVVSEEPKSTDQQNTEVEGPI